MIKSAGFCYKAWKVKWTGEAADARMKVIKRKRKKMFGYTPQQQRNFYKCDKCGMYHFTSWSADQYKQIEKLKKDAKKKAIRIRDEEIFMKYSIMLNSTPNVQESDTTEDDSSNAAK